MNYRFVGYTTDGLRIYQDTDYPSDAPQAYPSDAALQRCAGCDALIDGNKFFAVSDRHAEVRGLIARAMTGEEGAGDGKPEGTRCPSGA